MFQNKFLLAFFCWISLFIHAEVVSVQVPYVGGYNQALNNTDIWKDIPSNEVPKQFLAFQEMVVGSLLNEKNEFQNIWLKNDSVVVCYQNCYMQDHKKNVTFDKIEKFQYNFSGINWWQKAQKFFLRIEDHDREVLKQTNVYYYANHLIDVLAKLGFHFKKRMIFHVDSDLKDIHGNRPMHNNAFFQENFEINLLPSEPVRFFIFKMMELGDFSLDPFVIMHEMGHGVFSQLIGGKSINRELYALHEGFADYMAFIALNSPHPSLILFRGQEMDHGRNGDNYRAFRGPGRMSEGEVHSVGGHFGSTLWTIRKLFNENEKALADKIVLKMAQNLGRIPLANLSHIPASYLQAYDQLVLNKNRESSERRLKIEELWNKLNIEKGVESVDTEVIRRPLSIAEESVKVEIQHLHFTPDQRWDVQDFQHQIQIHALRSYPPAPELGWILVSMKNLMENTERTFWVLFDAASGRVASLNEENGEVIAENDSLYKDFWNSYESFVAAYSWYRTRGSSSILLSRNLVSRNGVIFFNSFHQCKSDEFFQEQLLNKYEMKLRRGVLLHLVGAHLPVQKIFYYTLPESKMSRDVIANGKFQTYRPKTFSRHKEVLMGYEVLYSSGVREKILIKEFSR